jgi:Zinc knuckle
MRSWKQINGDTVPSKYIGLENLLHPGVVEPGSSECYACGKTGHSGHDCTEMNKITTLKGNFHAIYGSILVPCYPPAQVNYITIEEDEFAWANTPTSYL